MEIIIQPTAEENGVYRGFEQMELVGWTGETNKDNWACRAIRAGCVRLVVVSRKDNENPFKEIFGARLVTSIIKPIPAGGYPKQL